MKTRKQLLNEWKEFCLKQGVSDKKSEKVKCKTFEEAIEKAKILSREYYELQWRERNLNNPHFHRDWVKYESEVHKAEGWYFFGLEGTPDKAFVKVDLKNKKVQALSQAQEVLKEFEIEG